MRRGSILWLLIGLLVSAPVRAQPATSAASATERAEQLFRAGTEAFEAARYSDAYGALLSAWDLAPSYRTAAGLGQVELRLGQHRDAARHLAYCLRNFPASGDPGARRHVEEGLAEAREHVAALRVRVDPEGADISIDGHSVGRSPLDGLAFVDPGSHVVQASAAGRTTQSVQIDAPVRGTRDVSLSLAVNPSSASATVDTTVPSSSVPLPTSPTSAPPPPPAAGLSNTAWALVIGGSLTAVATGMAVIFDVKGNSAAADVKDLDHAIGKEGDCTAPSNSVAPFCARLRDTADERNRDDKIAVVSAVTAGVLGAATIGTAIFLETRDHGPPATAILASMRIHPMPGGVALMLEGVL